MRPATIIKVPYKRETERKKITAPVSIGQKIDRLGEIKDQIAILQREYGDIAYKVTPKLILGEKKWGKRYTALLYSGKNVSINRDLVPPLILLKATKVTPYQSLKISPLPQDVRNFLK